MKRLTLLRLSISLIAIATLSACGGGGSETESPTPAAAAPPPAVSTNDTTPPVIKIRGDMPYELALGHQFSDPGAIATDDVDGEVAVTVNKPTISGLGTYAVKYTARDSAGNQASAERPVIVLDLTGPVITLNGPSNINLGFGQKYTEQGASANDNVDGAVDVLIEGAVGTALGNYTITYSAVDAAGNQSSTTRSVSVKDLTPPTITLNGPSTVTLSAGEQYVEQGAVAIDDVDGGVEVVIQGEVGQDVGTYTLTYLAADSAGNESLASRRVEVVDAPPSKVVVTDTTPPVITLNGFSAMAVEIGQTYIEPGATATDETDGIVDVAINGTVGEVLGTYTLTYTATDAAGNQSSIERSVSVVDTVAPVISLNGESSISLSAGQAYNELGATATDNVDGELNVTIDGTVGNDLGTYTITYTAVDSSGNQSSITRTVLVTDGMAPVITLNGAKTMTIAFGQAYVELGASATDETDGSVDVTISGAVGEDVGSYTITYSAVDSAGNQSSLTRTVNVVDTQAPVITLNGDEIVNLGFGETYVELGATAIDEADGELNVTIEGSVGESLGTYTITYSSIDSSGNKSTKERSVIVADIVAPVITLNGAVNLSIDYGTPYLEPGASANDDVDGTVAVVIEGTVDANIGEYTLLYKATDNAGNEASAQRTVKVQDTVAPVITLNGEANISLEFGQSYTELGASATDNADGALDVTITGSVGPGVGSYTITYSAVDASGNQSSVQRSVTVIDTAAPVITLNGEANINLDFGQPYNEPGATAIDAVDGVVGINITGSVGQAVGTYIITYTATDSSGNQAAAQRTVVIADTVPPVISLNGAANITLQFGESYNELGASATDHVDGGVNVTIEGSVGASVGTYILTYSAVDAAGNAASITRTVTVEDKIAPVVSLIGAANITIGFTEPYVELGATATDNADGTLDVIIDGFVGSALGDYIFTYSAQDASGNQASVSRTVTVADLDAPVITLNGSASMNLEFGTPYTEPGATAEDDVDGNVAVTITGTVGSAQGTYTLTYTATDSTGNQSTAERIVKIQHFLFEEDIARDIRQSTPTDVNIPKGLNAVFDIEYLGAFRVVAGGESRSDFAVGALGFNPSNNSIYMAGHAHHNAIAEFAIPNELSLESDPPNVVPAGVLQEYIKILDKREIGNQTNKITGILNFEDNLLVTSEIWYDGGGSNQDNLQVFSNADVLSASPVKGMLQIEGAAKAAGYMSKVPPELIDVLGAGYITGWASNYSITSRYSQGPSLYLFNPQDTVDAVLSVDRTITSSPLMVFPLSDGRELAEGGTQYRLDISPLWGPVSRAKYGFIIPGTSIFMALGKHGGLHSGVGYKITQDSGRLCPGQCTYEEKDNYNYFWLFDINDMLSAENPWDVRPISYGKWSHPYDNAGAHSVIGATFDDTNNILYMSLENAGQVGRFDQPPMIIAYQITAKN